MPNKPPDMYGIGVYRIEQGQDLTKPRPFDEGYDYEADKDIVERLSVPFNVMTPGGFTKCNAERKEAAGEIRALRLLVKNRERTIDNLIAERKADEDHND